VIAEDIASDPRWMEAPCRAQVLEHGLRAVWSTPIVSREGPVIGTICVYQQQPGSPSPYHQELIAHVAHLASIAIERSQAEAASRLSEFYLTEGQRVSGSAAPARSRGRWIRMRSPFQRNCVGFSRLKRTPSRAFN
jgi:GAF domain-containing protein